jgi:hypothetical protein
MLLHATEALTAIAPLRTVDLDGAFAFVINSAAVMACPSDAAVISPAVALQLSVDACGRTFVVDRSVAQQLSVDAAEPPAPPQGAQAFQ